VLTKEEISYLKSILENADDETLFALSDVFERAKEKLKKKKEKEPYQFIQRFPDIK
jgi:NTP pyrophosphatase (non-canonical NTP hydrolase)